MKYGKLAKEFGNNRLPLSVMSSSAGFYLGTSDEDGPFSRESEYFSSIEAAEKALVTGEYEQREKP